MAEDNQEKEEQSLTPKGGESHRASREGESPTPVPGDQKLPIPEDSTEERFTWRMLWTGILSFFQLETGLLLTFRDLILRPGFMVRSYLFTEERGRYTNPIGFILLSSALVAFLMFRFGDYDTLAKKQFEDGVSTGIAIGEKGKGVLPAPASNDTIDLADSTADLHQAPGASTLTDSISVPRDSAALAAADRETQKEEIKGEVMKVYSTLMAKYYNILMLIGVPMFAWWTWIFFRLDRFHFAEHMVVNGYILGMQNFLFLPIAPFMFTVPVASIVYLVISFIYQVFAYTAVFSGPTGMRLLRGVLVAIFSMMSYFFTLAILMGAIALIIVMPRLAQ